MTVLGCWPPLLSRSQGAPSRFQCSVPVKGTVPPMAPTVFLWVAPTSQPGKHLKAFPELHVHCTWHLSYSSWCRTHPSITGRLHTRPLVPSTNNVMLAHLRLAILYNARPAMQTLPYQNKHLRQPMLTFSPTQVLYSAPGGNVFCRACPVAAACHIHARLVLPRHRANAPESSKTRRQYSPK